MKDTSEEVAVRMWALERAQRHAEQVGTYHSAMGITDLAEQFYNYVMDQDG